MIQSKNPKYAFSKSPGLGYASEWTLYAKWLQM